MINLLVTGGAGFIGSNFVRYILLHEPEVRVVNLDLLTYAGSLQNLLDLPSPERHVFVQGDICDRALVDSLLRRYAIDTIVHFAAETHVDRSIVDPGTFIQTNVVGTFTLLEAARKCLGGGETAPLEQAISTMSQPTRCLARWRPATRPSPKTPPMRRARLTPLPRLPAITWCARTARPTVCRSPSPTAPIITAPISSPRN